MDSSWNYNAKTQMQHNNKRHPGRYRQAYSWHNATEEFLRSLIKESPLLHVCSGPTSELGDLRCDRHCRPIPPALIADWTRLPFAADSFAAVLADPPWNIAYMKPC